MDLTKLMKDLDAAVDVVEEKKAALEKAQADAEVLLKRARENAQVASQEHQEAVRDMVELRRQLDAALDSVATKGPAGVTVNG